MVYSNFTFKSIIVYGAETYVAKEIQIDDMVLFYIKITIKSPKDAWSINCGLPAPKNGEIYFFDVTNTYKFQINTGGTVHNAVLLQSGTYVANLIYVIDK